VTSDLCTITGVAIQAPGIARTCCVCYARCLTVEEMVRLAREQEEAIRKQVGKICGNCGGKFID
jgi:hypothetical protein